MWEQLPVLFATWGLPVEYVLYFLLTSTIVFVIVLSRRWWLKTISLILLFFWSLFFLGMPALTCPSGTVIAGFSVYSKGTYMVVDTGTGLPIYCSRSWNEDEAEQLHSMLQQGVPFFFDESLDDQERMFHPLPQPTDPLKENGPPPVEHGI